MLSLRRDDSERFTKTIAVVDVGSGSVGVAFVRLDRHGPPSILHQVRIDTPFEPSRQADNLAERILRAARHGLEELSAEYHRDARKHPERIEHAAFFLPAPWSTLSLSNLRLDAKAHNRQALKVTPELVKRMVASHARRESPGGEEEIIERSALGIKLNGYLVESVPKDTEASIVEVTLISTAASRNLLSHLRETAASALGRVSVSFHSTSIAAAYALSAMFPQAGDFLLCNSEGEITELLLAKEHTPQGVATSTAACNTILRTVAVHADMARAEAAAAVNLARDAHSPMARRLEKTLGAAQKECAEGFRAAAQELVARLGAPRTIYCLGVGPEAKWYADSIANAPYLAALFPAGASVEALSFNTISPHLKSRGPGDLYLGLESIFADARFDEYQTFNFSLA